ncbi:MAG: tripartite tricarboxylate transporter substrate binding protein [Alphaproteobacteria bacterium]
MILGRALLFALATLAAAVTLSGAHAESYPSRPVRFIVPFPAGGSTDVAARLIGEYLSHVLGQQFVVENKTGANGNIGIETAVKSPPDGYTILVTADAVASNPHVFHLNIDPTKDLLPIVQLSRQPMVLAAHPSLGIGTIAELTALAKREPGLRYATGSGIGSPQHMVVQWFAQIVGVKMEQVPYRGGSQAINDLIGGHIKLGSLGSTPLIPHYKAGTLKLLAQSSKARSPSLPEVPTFEEAGAHGLVLDQWLGVFAPAGTPAAITARLNAEINNALNDSAVRKGFADSAQEPIGGTPEQFAQFVREDYAKFGRLVKDLHIKAE